MDGDDIKDSNLTIPVFPDNTPIWHRILCVLGYHKSEKRQCGKDHKYPGMKLRNQCGRCNRLL